MKTDLAKILTVSGKSGLFLYVAQARGGVIAESLKDKKRIILDAHSKITTLADIAIYTQTEELKLSEVFIALNKTLEVSRLQVPSQATLILRLFSPRQCLIMMQTVSMCLI